MPVEDQLLVKPVMVEDQLLQSNLYWSRTNYFSQTCTGRGPIITVKPVLVDNQLIVKPVLVEDQLLVKPV